jgi:transposase
MFGFGSGGIHAAVTKSMFEQMTRKDQTDVLQSLYDQGYSGKDIASFFGMNTQTVYGRINAHRGRGPSLTA